ncbi:hypothetical protein BDU57DRAFT_525279 [Ampelomyces quisqualis]|uniref:Uncharacterized protein n=1 Tax=Ampelomyces quisqualis TaxID=50730 RepID=A0A6A5QWM4_AMPQU|nr:hypothetical protein BDU57DRAFT_525279 [Ampelomyces quisqualis]
MSDHELFLVTTSNMRAKRIPEDMINTCWATEPNTVALLDNVRMNETNKSLRAAGTSAAFYRINLAAFHSLTSNSASAPPAGSGALSSTNAPSPASSASSGGDSSSGLSGGVVDRLAFIRAIVFFLWRRRRCSTVAQADPSPPMYGHSTANRRIRTEHRKNAQYECAAGREICKKRRILFRVIGAPSSY